MNSESGKHPVTYEVEPHLVGRNRLTSAFRIVLALPHVLLVGGPGGVGFSVGAADEASSGGGVSVGVLGAAAWVTAIISWFAIVFTGQQPRGLWDFTRFYLGWRSRAVTYTALLRDEYPPFGDGAYPVSFGTGEFPVTRDRVLVGFRLILALPHAVLLLLIGFAWILTAFISWVVILLTGGYPESLYRFGVGYIRWSLRFEAYLLLMHDQYPPFSFD